MEAAQPYGQGWQVTTRRVSWYDEVVRERSNGYSAKPQRVKLDQMMHVLFRLSKRTMLALINELFDEHFVSRDVVLTYGNPVFVQDDYRRIAGDVVITVRVRADDGGKRRKPARDDRSRSSGSSEQVYYYHIEFQTLNDGGMAIRLFRYGFEQAVERVGAIEEDADAEEAPVQVLTFPKQLVIFLEENGNIPDELQLRLRLPDGEMIPYRVPVMKYWQTTAGELQKRGLHALLPLQAFKVRKRIQAIDRSARPEAEKGRLIAEQFALLRDLVAETVEVLRESHDQRRISLGDLERILRVLQSINEYMYGKYGAYKSIEEEAVRMVRTWYDPKVKRQAKREGFEEGIAQGFEQGLERGVRLVAQRLLDKGLTIHEVAEMTGLPSEQVADLK